MNISATIPSEKDISPTTGMDLDEQCALEHFYGLDQPAALKMFRDDADILHVYIADFVHMGDVAFDYYIPVLVQYLEELQDDHFVEDALDAADYILIKFSDSRVIPTSLEKLIGLIDSRLLHIPSEMIPELPNLLERFLAMYQNAEQGAAPNP